MNEALKQLVLSHIAKINFFVIGRAIIEIILFIIFMKVINKTLNLFFEKLISRLSDIEMKKQYLTLRQLGIYVIDTIIVLFFATNILESFGIDMKPILATAGVLGVAVGFGGKKFVEDVLTGLSIILTGQLRVGDYVTVNNSTGTVEKVMLTMIVIRSFNGDVHYLRNGQIDTVINQTKNFSYPLFKVSVAYKTNLNKAIQVLKDLGKKLREDENYKRFILSDLEIFGLDEFQDSSLVILCRFKSTPQEKWMIKRKFNQMIKEGFEKEGIEIPFPQIVVNEPSNKEEQEKQKDPV